MLMLLLTTPGLVQSSVHPPSRSHRVVAHRRCANVACVERETPRSDVGVFLELLEALRVKSDKGGGQDRRPPSLARTLGLPQPSGDASELSMNAVAQRSKRILAQPTPVEQRMEEMASLAAQALSSGRPHSARLAFEQTTRRLSKWRATNDSLPVSRALVRAGLLSCIDLRDRVGYERVLADAQDQWDVELAAEPSLLSAAMVGCCDAGWVHHAAAINLTLAANGLTPSCHAMNALLRMRLRDGDDDGTIDAFLDMKQRGPKPDRSTHTDSRAGEGVRRGARASRPRRLFDRTTIRLCSRHAA